MSSRVFISYNHKDKAIAEKISIKLKEAELKVIRDTEVMQAGEDIASFILNALKEADITISIISKNSLLSAWVAMESVYARYGAEVGKKVFIPTYIDDSFFSRGFVDDALDIIEGEIAEINTLIEKRTKRNRGIQDLQFDLQRFRDLQHNIDKIVAKFKGSLCIDISESQFEYGMSKIINDIHDYSNKPENFNDKKKEQGRNNKYNINSENIQINEGDIGIQNNIL